MHGGSRFPASFGESVSPPRRKTHTSSEISGRSPETPYQWGFRAARPSLPTTYQHPVLDWFSLLSERWAGSGQQWLVGRNILIMKALSEMGRRLGWTIPVPWNQDGERTRCRKAQVFHRRVGRGFQAGARGAVRWRASPGNSRKCHRVKCHDTSAGTELRP